MKKKVLIIGGAGFIGLNIVKHLVKNFQYDITIADNFFRGKMDEELKALVEEHGLTIVSADLTNMDAFKQLGNEYHQVYMLAAIVGVKYTEEMPHEIIRINSLLVLNCLEWLKTIKVGKALFSSTSECYAGTIDAFQYTVPTPEEVPLCINDIGNPRFTYAITKMLGESAFLNYSRVFGFHCTIVRYHNVYGPRMGFKHVIPQVALRFLDNENPFKIYGFGQTRSFNYIDDAVMGTVLAMEKDAANGEIIHIGEMYDEIKIEELVHYIGELLGFKGTYTAEESMSGSVSRRCPDTTKAQKLLGYQAKTGWKEGVKTTVNWYKDFIEKGGKAYE